MFSRASNEARFASVSSAAACRHSVEEIRALVGADSLHYLSLDGLRRIAPDARCGFCEGCFTGEYPIPV